MTAADPRVAGLVYIAAVAPDANETSQGQQAQFPVVDVLSHIDVADRVRLKPQGVPCFAEDLPEREQKVVWGNARYAGGGPVAQMSFRKRGSFRIML